MRKFLLTSTALRYTPRCTNTHTQTAPYKQFIMLRSQIPLALTDNNLGLLISIPVHTVPK